jgi:GH25 family lysozyme M1 (1,4-beta-N-acetylmuramidase)
MSAAARWLRRQYGYGPWFAWYAIELARSCLKELPGKDN